MFCKALTVHEKPCKNKQKSDGYCWLHANIFKLDRPEECAICTEDLNDKDRPLRCGHTFHRSCWNRWQQTKNQCPICRTNFQPNKNQTTIDLSSVDLTEENISLIAILISQVTGLPEQTARNIISEVGREP